MSTRHPAIHDAAQGKPSYTREEFAAWLTASCEHQGVPLIVTDPVVIARIGAVLGYPRPVPDRVQRRREIENLDTPDRLDAVDVQAASTRDAQSNDGVIEHRADDRAPTAHDQIGPLAA
jgi:hypothetical protein